MYKRPIPVQQLRAEEGEWAYNTYCTVLDPEIVTKESDPDKSARTAREDG